jgi:hypothetical protein
MGWAYGNPLLVNLPHNQGSALALKWCVAVQGSIRRKSSARAASRVAVKVRAMADHRFKIGQMVFFYPRSRGADVPRSRPFQITARLPAIDGENQYRIRSPFEEQERAASESELRVVQQF